MVDPSDIAVKDEFLPPLDFWNCEFESRQGHGGLSLTSGMLCQVEVSDSARFREDLQIAVSLKCDRKAPKGRTWPGIGPKHHRKK